MREYTFLLSNSFRSTHVKARTLREAWNKTNQWYTALSMEEKAHGGILTHTYQDCRINDYVLSGWKQSTDKKLMGVDKSD